MESWGVVYLPDLMSRRPWMNDKLPGILAAHGLALADVEWRTFEPPTHLIVLCNEDYVGAPGRFRAWLRDAKSVRLVIGVSVGLWDPELNELLEWELKDSLGDLHCDEIHWVEDLAQAEVVGELLRRGSPTPPVPSPQALPLPGFGQGPWCPLPSHSYRDDDWNVPSLVCVREGVPSLYLEQEKCFRSLLDGTLSEPLQDVMLGPFAVWPDGSRLFSCNYDATTRVQELATGEIVRGAGAPGHPIGMWPGKPVAWTGLRCVYSWLYVSSGRLAMLAEAEHEAPCGHAKKQYGYLDNMPCWVQLARDESYYLSVFQKDVVISSAVPLRWRAYEHGWAATSPACSDPGRAVFFIYEGAGVKEDPTFVHDCDVRDARPVMVLGPSAEARYALDLSRPVYRLTPEQSVLVHEPFPGFGVYDVAHRLVRLGSGRLLAGWDRWLTVWEDGRLRREDVVSGSFEDLGPEPEEVAWAFPWPGSSQVVLVGEGRGRLV